MVSFDTFSIPFSSLVGLNDAKLALTLVIIDPRIGGVLISGPKGTGKSSLVRSLYSILPDHELISNCPFKCSPNDPRIMCEDCKIRVKNGLDPSEIEKKRMEIVTLPLGATEDRVIGSLDIEKIIESGIEALSPGILAAANQEILYVDEINLLPDHLVDTILDCAASGWNIIERENISVQHPSHFVLIGTMNPEEGDLRPQLLDRLSLFAQVGNIEDINDRIRIVELNIQKEHVSNSFQKTVKDDIAIKEKIKLAREILPNVELGHEKKKLIAMLCIALKVDGFRSDIVIARASRAKAAYEARNTVTNDDIRHCAYLALLHRTRDGGMREPPSRLEIDQTYTKLLTSLKK